MNKKILYISFAVGLTIGITAALLHVNEKETTLCILHTNDTHSRVEPLGQTETSSGLGGYARRIEFIKQQRKTENVLLLDAGDFMQGTPYFNIFKGEIEIDAMNRMGYDAATLGNHEFDNPVDTLAKYLKAADFAVVVSNYNVKNSPLEDIVKPYHIVNKKGIKIGIVGAGVQLEGLVSMANVGNVTYDDPIEPINKYAKMLKEEKDCDVVICLSHLGYKYKSNMVSDIVLAQKTRNIDAIIGGHTHSLVVGEKIPNLDGDTVILSQMQKSGIYVGKMQMTFE